MGWLKKKKAFKVLKKKGKFTTQQASFAVYLTPSTSSVDDPN